MVTDQVVTGKICGWEFKSMSALGEHTSTTHKRKWTREEANIGKEWGRG